MAKERQGFVVYHEIKQALEGLTKEQCGELFLALLNYSIDGTIIKMDKFTEFAFRIYKSRIDNDKERYESKCEQMRANVSKRYESIQTNTNANKSKQKQPTKLNETKLNETKLNETKDDYIGKSSSEFLSVFLNLYEIKSDVSSMTIVRDLDFKKVMQAFNNSKWLRTEIKSLKWVVNNYQKIINGEYKDIERKFESAEDRERRKSEEESKKWADLFERLKKEDEEEALRESEENDCF